MDAQGRRIVRGATYPFMDVIDIDARRSWQISVQTNNSDGNLLSQDGRTLVYRGRVNPGYFIGLTFLDLESGLVSTGPAATAPIVSIDRAGERVGFLLDEQGIRQNAFYDLQNGTVRRLTALAGGVDNRICPYPATLGHTPSVSADGTTVAFAIDDTLGIAPDDPGLGCRIFAYTPADDRVRYVAGLPSALSYDLPAISADGRWLSFITPLRPSPELGSRPVGGLVDLQSGEVQIGVAGVIDTPVFDTVVTGDGSAIILSTTADLDPDGGNADHNLELFRWDRASGRFSQITRTTGGPGPNPDGCSSYRPLVSHDGSVVAFHFYRLSIPPCELVGEQRDERDGFVFTAVRAVQRRPGNQPVELTAPGERVVRAGESLSLELSARDADDDPIFFFAQLAGGDDLPAGATISDDRHGHATIRWVPTGDQVGDYELRVAAYDEGGGGDLHSVRITVEPSPRPCSGDCNGDDAVTISELVRAVNIALGHLSTAACPAADPDGDGTVTVDELVACAGRALDGCASPTAAP